MRVMVAGALLALLVEVLLALAFWAGWGWLGGLLGGAWGGGLVAALVALVLVALGSGDLEVDYDSGRGVLDVRVGRLARIVVTEREKNAGREIRTRLLFVRWTRIVPARADTSRARAAETAARAPRGEPASVRERVESASRALSAAAPALHDLVWESRELSLLVRAPTGIGFADRTLATLFGERNFGPARLTVATGATRAVQAHYRIRFYRAALTLIAALVQGQPQRAARAFRASGAPPQASAGGATREGVT